MPMQHHMSRHREKIIDPFLPRGVEILVPPPPEACSALDKFLVYASSLIVVGSPLWFYGGIIYLYRKWKYYRSLATQAINNDSNNEGCVANEDDDFTSSGESSQESNEKQPTPLHQIDYHRTQQYERYKNIARKYGIALAAIILISLWGPHRSKRVGNLLNVRRWRLWDAWLNYVGFTVLHDKGDGHNAGRKLEKTLPRNSHQEFNIQTSPAIFAFVPHGIFPFGLAFSCLPERGYDGTWGIFRPVVATATKLFPLVRTFIGWMSGVDASRSAVSTALAITNDNGLPSGRVGISPGGIAEMFETYPKPGFHRNDEAALLKHRNGMFKLALQHKLPIVPVYCFGATKMFRRVQLPEFMETLSRALKISLCLLFGKLGLPIPFRQRLMYVMGKTIFPPALEIADNANETADGEFEQKVQEMHDAFCDEVIRIFENNKEYYGWGDKTLRLV